jgi:hypothetical protein
MSKLKLVDGAFSHSEMGYCSDFQTSKIFQWDRTPYTNEDTVIFTDTFLKKALDSNAKHKVAWLIEPIDIGGQNYEFVKNNLHTFDRVLTHEKSLLDLGGKYQYVPFGCCWIKPEDQKVYDKSKNISIIASGKKQTIGHRLRHDVVNRYRNKIDVLGRGWKPIPYKLQGLKDYRFSVVIENCKRDYWFTEKLIDCFTTGTIPIYWGCPSIGDFFDTNGIIIFNDVDELGSILDTLDEEKYQSMIESVKYNYETSMKYLLPDEHVYNNTTTKMF